MTPSVPLPTKIDRDIVASPTREARALPPRARRSWRDFFRRDPPTVYHRCLAVHLYFAERPGGLS